MSAGQELPRLFQFRNQSCPSFQLPLIVAGGEPVQFLDQYTSIYQERLGCEGINTERLFQETRVVLERIETGAAVTGYPLIHPSHGSGS